MRELDCVSERAIYKNNNEESIMTVGSRIKKEREKIGISQTDFAKMIGISKQTLYKYEANIVINIPTAKIKKISEKLGVSIPYLMGLEFASYMLITVRKVLKEEIITEKFSTRQEAYDKMKSELLDRLKIDGDDKCMVMLENGFELSNVFLKENEARIIQDYGESSHHWKIVEI